MFIDGKQIKKFVDFKRAWLTFNQSINAHYTKQIDSQLSNKPLAEKLKMQLQIMMTALSQEEEAANLQMGECLEYLLSEKIPLVLIGLAKSNNPEGLLQLGLRFMISLLTSVRNQNILAQSDTH